MKKFEERRNEKGQKLYPFSIQKHAHSIEFRYNRMRNIADDMFFGTGSYANTEYDEKEYDKLQDMINEFEEVYEAMFYGFDSVAWLTGRQLSLAKEAVNWAENARSETQLKKRFN